jgi:bile acid:Na+ symporter, BASS family
LKWGIERLNLATLIPLVLRASILLTVFAIGLRTKPQDLVYVFQRPRLLLRSLLSIDLIMPLFAGSLVAVTSLPPFADIALLALSVAPIPPRLPKKARTATGDGSYAIGLLVVASVLAIVLVPLSVDLLSKALGQRAEIPIWTIASILVVNVLAPLAAGILVHHFAPALAERIEKPLTMLGSILLAVSVIPILIMQIPAILTIGDGTVIAVVAFIFVGLAAGHLLGGPDPANRTVLALTTSSRHPGIAIAIANANFPEQELVVPTIALYLLLNILISIAYKKWAERRHPEAGDR